MKIKTLIACLGAFITLISGVGFNTGVRIDIWTHFMRGCIIDYVH